MVLTNGPFVLSIPWLGAALFSPEKGTMGHCTQQKGPLVWPPACWAPGSLFGFAQGGRGHQRGLLGAHVLAFPPGSSSLGADLRGPVHLREWTPQGLGGGWAGQQLSSCPFSLNVIKSTLLRYSATQRREVLTRTATSQARGGKKHRHIFTKSCVFILTCLIFSHLRSALHVMQYTHRDVFPLLKSF